MLLSAKPGVSDKLCRPCRKTRCKPMPLISPEALFQIHADPDCVVTDCRFDLADSEAGLAAWAAAHVPGARYAHLDEDLASPVSERGGRHPLPDPIAFARRLAEWGVDPDHLVVAYDDSGCAIAGRLWWLLRHYGHRRVAVLDGGFSAWRSAGLPVATSPAATATASPRALVPGQTPTVDADAIQTGLRGGNLVLVDVRAESRFAGIEEPLDKIGGHVPGALNLPLTGNVDAEGRFLPPAQLRARFDDVLAGRPANDLVVMCGSGVSACQTLIALEQSGLPGASLYVGSWSDWISDPDRPIARL